MKLIYWLALGAFGISIVAPACVGDTPEGSNDGSGTDAGNGTGPGDDAAVGPGGEDSGGKDHSVSDAGSDAAVAAPPPCDLAKPFLPPLQVQGVNSVLNEQGGHLSQDERNIYFGSDQGDAGPEFGLYVASRMDRGSPFTGPKLLANVNVNPGQYSPSVTADGLTLAFQSKDQTTAQIFLAMRTSAAQDFLTPEAVSGVNSTGEITPFLSSDGSEMWFSSTRSASHDIYRAPRVGQTYANPVSADELNSASTETAPTLGNDGLVIFWGSDRPDGNAKGGYDIWMASRLAKNLPFSGIKNVEELNLSGEDIPNWLSPDGCRLYFQSRRDSGVGGSDFFVAERPK